MQNGGGLERQETSGEEIIHLPSTPPSPSKIVAGLLTGKGDVGAGTGLNELNILLR